MTYFFTADEHYGHKNIIKYCNRPFSSAEEMDDLLIENHNSVVSENDITIHAGDFSIRTNKDEVYQRYIEKLNGRHIFLRGSHDKWLPRHHDLSIFEKNIEGQHIVICHYALRVWSRSHYNSWQLYGHSHGKLAPQGKQWDVGVDNNNYFPVSFDQIQEIMSDRPDNFNLVKRKEKNECT